MEHHNVHAFGNLFSVCVQGVAGLNIRVLSEQQVKLQLCLQWHLTCRNTTARGATRLFLNWLARVIYILLFLFAKLTKTNANAWNCDPKPAGRGSVPCVASLWLLPTLFSIRTCFTFSLPIWQDRTTVAHSSMSRKWLRGHGKPL